MAFEFIPTTPEFKQTLEKMFTDEFMQKYTNFENFRDFKSSSAVFLNWESAFMVYNAEVFDGFVKESTQFSSWEEMIKTASEEIMKKKTEE